MREIILDKATIHQLEAPGGRVTICDSTGRTVGYFYPPDTDLDALYEEIRWSISDEELDRRRNSGDSLSTAEVREYLKGL